MRARETRSGSAALRMAKAALMNREVEKGRALDEAEAQQVIASLIKQRRDSIEQFRKGGREDLADKEAAEIATLEAYLPPPVDPAEIERAVDEAIAETGATSREGPRQGDEGGDAEAGRPGGRRQDDQRDGAAQTRGVKIAKPFRGRPSNQIERHAQASHPSSIRLLSQGRSLFLYRASRIRTAQCPRRPNPDGRSSCRQRDRVVR